VGDGLIVPFVLGKDDTIGDNISNRSQFSEARGHYWLWRNMRFADDEFVAINQYRRCFWFPQLIPRTHRFFDTNRYFSEDVYKATIETTRKDYLEYIHMIDHTDLSPLNEWLRGADLVVNRHLYFNAPLYQLYGQNHIGQDWEIFASVLRKHGYNDGRFNWLTTHTLYIFTPELFNYYMTDWWEVMSEVADLVGPETDSYQSRKLGFMTEWFMSMWLIKLRIERPTTRIQTLPVLEGRFELDRVEGEM
jgi:hypothetical protein